MRQGAREIVAQIAMRMVLQVGVERAGDGLPLPWTQDDLTTPTGATEDHLTDTQRNEQPQWPAQGAHEGKRVLMGGRNRLDDLASCIGNEDAAGGVDRLERHHGEIPPPEARDEVPDEPERRIR